MRGRLAVSSRGLHQEHQRSGIILPAMGLLDRILGRPPSGTLPDGSHHPVAEALRKEIKRRLEHAPIRPAARLRRVSRGLMTLLGSIGITIDYLEVEEEKIHAHVVTSIANYKSPRDVHLLDACVFGRGTETEAVAQAAEI